MVFVPFDRHPSGFSGSGVFNRQGQPIAEGYRFPNGSRMGLGYPAYDLRRTTEGPALYLNGPPDTNVKMSLATGVQRMTTGRFAIGERSTNLVDAKVACKKTLSGGDPYNVHTSNPWHQRSGKLQFRVENGETRRFVAPRPDCSRSLNLDPYSVNTRDNCWANFGRPVPSSRPAITRATTRSRKGIGPGNYYFSPFPESLNTGSRAHTPRTPQAGPTAWTGARTEPTLSGAKAWGFESPRGVMSPERDASPPATLPPLPAAARF